MDSVTLKQPQGVFGSLRIEYEQHRMRKMMWVCVSRRRFRHCGHTDSDGANSQPKPCCSSFLCCPPGSALSWTQPCADTSLLWFFSALLWGNLAQHLCYKIWIQSQQNANFNLSWCFLRAWQATFHLSRDKMLLFPEEGADICKV